MKKTILFFILINCAFVFAESTEVVALSTPLKLEVKSANGDSIPQWSNPSLKTHIEVQLFLPTTNAKKTAVVVIPGSGGGLPVEKAQEFADKGYPALAVRYFDYSPNSDYVFSITQLPLENFKTAIDWVKANVANIKKVVLHGRSRGGEAVLLVGEKFPGLVDGIIAEVPSIYSWGDRANGIWTQYLSLQPNVNHETASWTVDGVAVDFVNLHGWLQTKSIETTLNDLPLYTYTKAYKYAIKKANTVVLERARVKVENIRVPVMVTGGGVDQVWPSFATVEKIKKHRKTLPASIRSKDIYMNPRNAGHVWMASVTSPFWFPSGVYDLAKSDFSNICAESDLEEYLDSLVPMQKPKPTGPGMRHGYPYKGHKDEILNICSENGAELYYYLAPEYAKNGGTPESNGRWGEQAKKKIKRFLNHL